MFIKNLLVAGMLVVGVVDGMEQSLLDRGNNNQNQDNNNQSVCKRMEESDFFNKYSNLRINIGSRIGFQNLKDLDPARFGKLQEDMSTIEGLLSDVCFGVVANYSKGKEEELASLTEDKFSELTEKIPGFFKELGDALKARKGSIGFWEGLIKRKTEKDNLSDFLKTLDELKGDLEREKFAPLLMQSFRVAYESNLLRRNEGLQQWYKLYEEYLRSNDHALHCFAPSIIQAFNNKTDELAKKICLNEGPEVNEWHLQCQALRRFCFPSAFLTQCSLEQDALMQCLEEGNGEYRLNQKCRQLIAESWKNSVEEMKGKRCKFFISFVPVSGIERFFCESGGTCFTISVIDLLNDYASADLLEEALWGSPLKSPATPKGLILNALLAKTNEGNSYKNATLIVSDVEELCSVEQSKQNHVRSIWEFFKFITDKTLEASEGNASYRFPYLGIKNKNEGVEKMDLSKFNVVLSTSTMLFQKLKKVSSALQSLQYIFDGVSPVVGESSARALRNRMNLIVDEDMIESYQ